MTTPQDPIRKLAEEIARSPTGGRPNPIDVDIVEARLRSFLAEREASFQQLASELTGPNAQWYYEYHGAGSTKGYHCSICSAWSKSEPKNIPHEAGCGYLALKDALERARSGQPTESQPPAEPAESEP
jgi:hypothetical protein